MLVGPSREDFDGEWLLRALLLRIGSCLTSLSLLYPFGPQKAIATFYGDGKSDNASILDKTAAAPDIAHVVRMTESLRTGE